ncbi:hypothetical protein DFH07DRAFT_948186 [Mycena maculata]|uniref:Uncharacterized protein n=1 Tax=Mycena maculata TaxID=230809 RepID=A0AAD7KI29_9AGAR|nr:hypothetical protein DFH07DRAFT_948186 [Mycena maculata]
MAAGTFLSLQTSERLLAFHLPLVYTLSTVHACPLNTISSLPFIAGPTLTWAIRLQACLRRWGCLPSQHPAFPAALLDLVSVHSYCIGESLDLFVASKITRSPSRAPGMHTSSTLCVLVDPRGLLVFFVSSFLFGNQDLLLTLLSFSYIGYALSCPSSFSVLGPSGLLLLPLARAFDSLSFAPSLPLCTGSAVPTRPISDPPFSAASLQPGKSRSAGTAFPPTNTTQPPPFVSSSYITRAEGAIPSSVRIESTRGAPPPPSADLHTHASLYLGGSPVGVLVCLKATYAVVSTRLNIPVLSNPSRSYARTRPNQV